MMAIEAIKIPKEQIDRYWVSYLEVLIRISSEI